MLSAPQLNLVVAAVFAFWAVSLLATGTQIQAEFFKPFSVVSAGLGALLAFFNRTAWRWRVWRGWLVRRPNLAGTWQVALTPTGSAPVDGFMVVRQTLTSLTLRLLTAESSSMTLASSIVRDLDGMMAVAAVYRAEPRLPVRDRSPIHNGAFYLTISSDPAGELVGHYWTDRGSSGELRMHDRRDSVVGTFADAQIAFTSKAT